MMLINDNRIQILRIDGEENHQLEVLGESQLRICEQQYHIRQTPQTITVNYEHSLMSGFQFRKLSKKIQYRWFKINTISRQLINGSWKYI